MNMEYAIKWGKMEKGKDNLKELIHVFEYLNVKRAILLYRGNKAMHYSNLGEVKILIELPKSNVGASKFYEKKILEKFRVKARMSSIDELFELAEELEEMDLDSFIKKKLRGEL